MKNGNGKSESTKGEEKEKGLGTYARLGAAITAFEAGKLPRGTKLIENVNTDTCELIAPRKGGDPHVFIEVSRGDMIRFLAKRCGLALRVEQG